MVWQVLLGPVMDIGKEYLKGRKKLKSAKLDMQLASMQNKARLLADHQSHNNSWEMAQLEDKDKWLRRFSFLAFSAPFIVAIFAPEQVALYFNEAISSVPMWWQKTYMAITGAIWGLSSLKNTVPGLLEGLLKPNPHAKPQPQPQGKPNES